MRMAKEKTNVIRLFYLQGDCYSFIQNRVVWKNTILWALDGANNHCKYVFICYYQLHLVVIIQYFPD